MRTIRLTCFLALLLGLSGSAGMAVFAQVQHDSSHAMSMPAPPAVQNGDPHQLSDSEAVQLADTVNRVEADFFSRNHRYASLESLMKAHLFTGRTALPVPIGRSGAVKDHTFRMLTSPDRLHYLLSVAPEPPGCGFAVFSDESGAVYTSAFYNCADAAH